MSTPFKVVIVGSGLAGSLLANGLIHNDVEVSVYERLEEHSKREGYQIRLGAPALQGMRTCLKQNQLDALVQKFGRANGTKSGAPIIYDQHFNQLVDLAKFPAYSKSAPINRVILRDALAEPVAAAGKLKYGKAFDRYEILNPGSEKERVRVWFANGESEDCDLLIAADGSHSKINKQVGLDNIHPITSHITAICKSDLPTEKYLKMSPRLSISPVMTFSNNRAVYFCAYLPDKFDSPSDAGKAKPEIDEGLSSSMFAAVIPADEAPDGILEKSNKEKWDFVKVALKDWSKEFHETIDLVNESEIYMYKARASTQPRLDWRKSASASGVTEHGHPRVWLMGDAIHPMLPTRGMGGNMAMRDAATILPLVLELAKQSSSTTQDFAKACYSYESEMIPRAFEMVKKSGGLNPIPVDSNTYIGSALFFMGGQIANIAYVGMQMSSLLWARKQVDDAPELRT